MGEAKKNPALTSALEQLQRNASLPALDKNLSDLCLVTNQTTSSAADLAAVIMRDAGLSSNIISTINSVAYRPVEPVKTISNAVILLGFEKVRALVLGLSIFRRTAKSLRDKGLARLYASSYFSGTFAMSLARRTHYKNPEEIFVAGLLHQLPQIALANAYPKKYKEMEQLAVREGLGWDQACKKVFDFTYTEIGKAVAGIYNMPEKVLEVLDGVGSKSEDPLVMAVQEGRGIANMIFGEKAAGKKALEETEKRIGKMLKAKKFSITEFVERACNEDDNMKRFFDLKEDDIEMMVKLLEWGKACPAQIAPGLALGNPLDAEMELAEQAVDPAVLFGQFVTDLVMARRRHADVNEILMIAHEALYRCLDPAEVFTAFLNRQKRALQGRLYTGSSDNIKATDFRVALAGTASPLVETVLRRKPGRWSAEDDASLDLPSTVDRRLKLRSAVFSPIVALNRPVGMHFAGRATGDGFTDREQAWIEEVSTQVGLGLEEARQHAGA